jgi:DNA-binding PadR family transcriptional regulator
MTTELLDRTSQHLLANLDEMEEATAAELREAVGVEQNQQIHYRMNNKLLSHGFVDERDTRRSKPGATKDARVYQITNKGKEWVADYGSELTFTDLDEAEEEIQRLTERVHEMRKDVLELKKFRKMTEGHRGGVKSRLANLTEAVDEIRTTTNTHASRDYDGIWETLHRLENHGKQRRDSISWLKKELNGTTKDVERNERRHENLKRNLTSDYEDVRDSQMEFSEWSRRMDRRVNQLENETFLDRLLPWR